MKLIVITTPDFLMNEAELLRVLFENGLYRLHLRKPGASAAELSFLLDRIPAQWHPRIVIHDHYELADRYALAGIHLNRRNIQHQNGRNPYSCSCHSFAEITRYSEQVAGYVFLSPLFDSISKIGYKSGFTELELRHAFEVGVLHDRVIALGGINKNNISSVRSLGFGGVAVLGALWEGVGQDSRLLSDRFLQLQRECNHIK